MVLNVLEMFGNDQRKTAVARALKVILRAQLEKEQWMCLKKIAIMVKTGTYII